MRIGQSQQDQDLQCGSILEGTVGLVAHRLINLKASRNQSSQQVSQAPLLCRETDSAFLTLSLRVVEGPVWRDRLIIPYVESLSCEGNDQERRVYIFYSPVAPPTVPDSASESSYLVQFFIVRFSEKRPPLGDTHSDSQ